MNKHILFLLFCLSVLVGCTSEIVSNDPSLQLVLSTDSLAFDTVFTGFGTSTRRIVLRNPNKHALCITQARLQDGRFFKVNIDGEADSSRWQTLTIRGGDSAFIFVRAYIDPLGQDNPVIIEDDLQFFYNGNSLTLPISAIGQDVVVLRQKDYSSSQHFTAAKPYLIFDTLIFRSTLTIDAGATLYMDNNATLIALGDVSAEGALEQPITIRGARTDRLFDSVPYKYASGQWGGFYLLHSSKALPPTFTFRYVHLLSGNIGLFCQSEAQDNLPKLTFENGVIHNMSIYGLVCLNTDALIANNEISNCAAYGVYLQGGTHSLVHNTIANYFGYPYTNLNIHSTSREDVAAVYINNLSKSAAPMQTYLYNNIVTGAREQELILAAPLPEYFIGQFEGNYLCADTFFLPQFSTNAYARKDDTLFVNNHYLYKEYRYFDFHLDSVAPARGIGVEKGRLLYPLTQEGNERPSPPDAGCY